MILASTKYNAVNKLIALKLLEYYGLHATHRGKWRVHELLRSLSKADVDQDFEVKRDGLNWVLNPADSVERDVFWYGVKDVFEIFHIKRLIRPGDIIFDVGANFGYYSIKLATLLNGNCRIYAFEPYPPTFLRLVRNINGNGLGNCIFPFELGFSDVFASTTMVETPGNTGGTYVSRSSCEGGIRLVTIESFCRDHDIGKIDFMKIDVEGLEPLVLKGAIPYFDESEELPVILIELNPDCLNRMGFSVEDIYRLLRKYNYSLYAAHRTKLLPLKELPRAGDLVNAFCFPKKM